MNRAEKDQSRLMDAITAMTPNPGYEQRGLAVYQGNLRANAIRALEISYPIITMLTGEGLFRQLAKQFLYDSPLRHGDWGQWGADFPRWLTENAVIYQQHPYLGDCARLSWQAHQCERAGDTGLNPTSFQQLSSARAAAGHFTLAPGLSVLQSPFPVVDIWLAHTAKPDVTATFMDQARHRLEQGKGQTALLWRKQWQAQVIEITSVEALWLQQLLAHSPLEQALAACQSEGFNFADWLPTAIAEQIVTGFHIPARD